MVKVIQNYHLFIMLSDFGFNFQAGGVDWGLLKQNEITGRNFNEKSK